MQKMYVLVRKDLPKTYQAVQAGHSIAEYLLAQPFLFGWNNGTMVFLRVKNEKELLKWGEKFDSLDKPWAGFREPDIGNQMTAITTIDNGELFKGMELL